MERWKGETFTRNAKRAHSATGFLKIIQTGAPYCVTREREVGSKLQCGTPSAGEFERCDFVAADRTSAGNIVAGYLALALVCDPVIIQEYKRGLAKDKESDDKLAGSNQR